jgi:plastocyanin
MVLDVDERLRELMKKAAIVFAPLLVAGALTLGACGQPTSTGNTSTATSSTVTMSATDFDQHAITIKAGTALILDDTDGSFHQICLGKDMQCKSNATAPKDLQNSGFSINGGEKHTLTFDTPGTYEITCSVHPDMNLTVTVQ